ncbi:methionyl-tRNA formyltransferase [Clavibacter michiganensis subsp. phaseoli]|uniref:methionyl-tRNA formyltransferase n=1 Tax=Clavibacter phaseoli TaxID=1734031 RepID=UPI001FB53C8C|nr:methionyl-tRNA formyltransferase [Clavibacter phaseoli]MCJ1711273.1 methionyl-tRNA formyltransferase [Clavibacter phaseoli]
MRLVFAGTPLAAVPPLRSLAASGHEVALVVTRADAPLGRKRVLTPSPVAAEAELLGIPTLRVNRLDDEATARVAAVGADLGVIVAYGGLVREPLLSTPARGWINLHFSLLPRWRGAAPVQRSIMAGERVTGASVFQLERGMDTGPVFAMEERPTGDHETAGHVLDALAVQGADLLLRTVDAIGAGTAVARPQEGEPTLAPKTTIDDGRVDWARPADEVLARIRGVTPEPGAHTTVADVRLKIHRAAALRDAAPLAPGAISALDGRVAVGTASHPIELIQVQPAGKNPMPAADWWRGVTDEDVTAR